MAVLAVSGRFASRIVRDYAPPTRRPWGGEAGLLETPLLKTMVLEAGGQAYAVAGAVSVEELDRIAAAIASGEAAT